MSTGLSSVAIVGRPNVGKSTLFNRLTRTRRAIMEETAGVTRDRIYGRAEWDGIVFDVIDTGGVENPDGDVIRTAMMEQTDAAIAEADVVVVLFDVKDGLTPTDHDVLTRLRGVKKPIFYAANKVDNEKRKAHAYEMYEAGLDNLYLISGEHRLGLEELLDAVVEALPNKVQASSLETDEAGPIKISVVGRPNAGKSSLLNALVGSDRAVVTDIAGTTRDVVDTEFEVDGQEYVILDTAGIRRKNKTTEKLEKFTIVKALEAIRRSHVVLLVLDASRGIGEDQDAKIAGYVQDAGRGVVVVVNKWDLVKTKSKDFEKELRYWIRFLPFARFHFVSALTGDGVAEIMPTVKAAYKQFNRRIATAQVNKVVQAALEKNPPASPGGRVIKIRFATQVAVRPPTFVLVCNRPKDVHVTYQRYLSNQLYEAFGLKGTPLKLRFREPKGRWKASEKFS